MGNAVLNSYQNVEIVVKSIVPKSQFVAENGDSVSTAVLQMSSAVLGRARGAVESKMHISSTIICAQSASPSVQVRLELDNNGGQKSIPQDSVQLELQMVTSTDSQMTDTWWDDKVTVWTSKMVCAAGADVQPGQKGTFTGSVYLDSTKFKLPTFTTTRFKTRWFINAYVGNCGSSKHSTPITVVSSVDDNDVVPWFNGDKVIHRYLPGQQYEVPSPSGPPVDGTVVSSPRGTIH